jgi:hypothetical protein
VGTGQEVKGLLDLVVLDSVVVPMFGRFDESCIVAYASRHVFSTKVRFNTGEFLSWALTSARRLLPARFF